MNKISIVFMLLLVSLFCSNILYAEKIKKINITGTQRINQDYILSLLSSKEEDEYSDSTINRDLKNIYATDLFSDVSANFQLGILEIILKENPIVTNIKFAGNKKLKEDTLTKELTLVKRSPFSPSKLNLDAQRITELYYKNGYLSAVVVPEIINQEFDRVDITFNITEGKKSVIKEVNFIGNKNFSKGDLEGAMLTKASRWWRILNQGEVYDKNRILYDGELLREFYLENGYPNFSMISTFTEVSPKNNQFLVTYTLEEGERYRFGDVIMVIRIPELEQYSNDLKKLVDLDNSLWYKNSLLQRELNKIRNKIKELGFQFIAVNTQLVYNDLARKVDIAIIVEEEPRVFINKINISGNNRSKDYVIRRELQFLEQDAYTQDAINEATRNLYKTQYFQVVNINSTPAGEGKVNVDVNVEETSTGSISVGGGYSTLDGLQFETSYNEGNLFGTGKTLNLSLTISQISNNYSISLGNPYFLGRKVYAGISLYRVDTQTSTLSSSRLYDQTEQGVSFSLGYNLTNDLIQRFNYRLFTRNFFNISPNASLAVQELAGKSLGSVVSHTLSYDKKDNAYFTTKGYELSNTTDYSGIVSEYEYVRNTFKGIFYYSLYENVVLSALGSVGVIEDIRGSKINIVDKYTLGGATLRGFKAGVNQGGVGPVDKRTGESLGGKYMYRGSFQIETPIPLVKNYGLIVYIFNDFGTVTDYSKDPNVIDTGSIRVSAGVGISWRSPVGIIGLDFGYPIKKEPTDTTELIYFNIGTRF